MKVLTVHGRTKEQKKQYTGSCNWDAIKTIKELVKIPVIANGGIECYEDVVKCFEYTGADAVMSSEKLLENSYLFTGELPDLDKVALEYLEIAEELDEYGKYGRDHMFKWFYKLTMRQKELAAELSEVKTLTELRVMTEKLIELRKDDNEAEKFGWYERYRFDGLTGEKKELEPKFSNDYVSLDEGGLDEFFCFC